MSRGNRGVAVTLIVIVSVVLLALFGLYLRAAARTNQVALAAAPKPVSVEKVKAGSFRATRTYVDTLQPWGLAKVGPQYVSAYVGTVLVRPGATVKRGEVLATLDCRSSSAASREVAARAKALEERRDAMAHEADRMKQMTEGGFAAANDVEQLAARTSAQSAEIEGMRAAMVGKSLEVDDCILRAPFAGEVADRFVDPGAYVRPGQAVVTLIDRNTVRVTADAPESDFAVVAPESAVRIEASAAGKPVVARISRRSPSADETTRTVHFEVDVPNASHALPVGTTATLAIDVGEPRPASLIPLRGATVRGDQATLFRVDGGTAKRVIVAVLGESGGTLFLAPSLAEGTSIVIEGRALLDDGDRVSAKEIAKENAKDIAKDEPSAPPKERAK